MSTEHSRVRASRSRPRTERNATSSSSVPYVPQVESLILPDGPVGEEATELLNDFVHPHQHAAEETLIGSEQPTGPGDKLDKKSQLPWWKRPSPLWLLCAIPFSAMVASITIAPRIEIYTILACSVHKPDIFRQNFPELELGLRPVQPELPILDLHGLAAPTTAFHAVYFAETSLPLDSSPGNGSDTLPPARRNQCASDPVVQAAVAKLSATITTVMGVLSCITTGYWGSFADRHGRTRVMTISIMGLLITDANFIIVTLFSKHLPGGYWFLVVGPFLEGLLGGMTTGVAAFHAYMADTTNESNRSRIFSLSLGLLFCGMAIGPTLGSLLIRFTGHTLSVFYVAAFCHFLYTILVWFILPESVTKEQMEVSKEKYKIELEDTAAERENNPTMGVLVKLRRLFAFLSPLAIFMPEEKKVIGNPLKKPKKDWSLTLIAIGYGFTISMMGSYAYKFQYAASQFSWTSETIGYWLSLISVTRAIVLTVFLPLGIKLLKPKPIVIELPETPAESTPLLGSSSDGSGPTLTSSPVPKRTKEIHSPAFDLGLARISLVIEAVSYLFMGLAPTALAFTVFGVVASLGTGFSPATQAVALALYARRGGIESGRLFGALAVIQALCSQILGPSIYGLVYVKTVATYPRAIFFVSVATLAVAFVLFAFIKLPSENEYRRESIADLEESTGAVQPSRVQEATLIGDEEEESDRARKRTVGSSTYGATVSA